LPVIEIASVYEGFKKRTPFTFDLSCGNVNGFSTKNFGFLRVF